MKTKLNFERMVALWLGSAIALLFCPAGSVSAQVPEESLTGGTELEDQARYQDLGEEIEVMCRVINRRMSDKFREDYYAESFFSEGCKGFYIPEVGSVFVLRVKFPVWLEEPTQEEEAEPKQADLWDQEKWGLRLGRGKRGSLEGGAVSLNIDPLAQTYVTGERLLVELEGKERINKKLSDLKREIIGILGTYGRRMSNLRDDERIVVTVVGDMGEGVVFLDSTGGYGTAVTRLRRALGASRVGDVSGTTLVISARVGDLPKEPPTEVREDAEWVRILAY